MVAYKALTTNHLAIKLSNNYYADCQRYIETIKPSNHQTILSIYFTSEEIQSNQQDKPKGQNPKEKVVKSKQIRLTKR